MDLNLLSFFTGKTEVSETLDILERISYNVLSFPEQFTLPERITMEYLNADAFRLGVEENVFNEENVTSFLEDKKQLFENRMANLFPELSLDPHTRREDFDQSLLWDGDISQMDETSPVIVSTYTHSTYPATFELSFLPPTVEVVNQSLNFTGLQNQQVTYRVVFPKGISVNVNDSLNKVAVKLGEDGREYLEVTFNVSEAGLTNIVTFQMVASPLFVLGIFMPCILTLIITIILLIAIYLIRKKRKKGKVVIEEDTSDGYEGQEYYVPPSPPGKQ
jgi:hypothetical protein